MNGKIIAVTIAIVLCIALSGCKSNQSEPVTETSAAISASEISETSETTETTSVTTTAESSDTTVSETSETVKRNTVPEIELSDLKAVYGEKLYSTPECKIIHDFIYENEEDFPAPEHIALARKAVFADEECMDSIKRYNDDIAGNEFGFLPVETEEDLPFVMGASYDFDGDGENESVVSLDLTPASSYFMDDGAIYYIDGENVFCLSGADGGSVHFGVHAFDFGTKTYIEITEYAGATMEASTVYCTDGGTLEPVIDCGGSGWINYRDGVFYYRVKYEFADYPIVFCEDGKFRQLGIREITEEDFSAHFENGREYLDYLKSEKNVTGIYTMGYYRYQIDFDDGFIGFYINEDGNATKNDVYYEFPVQDWSLTEEFDYDIDISKLDVIPYSE
ncbi:MAG: hypothetical protein K2N71_08785 [Oscillospiraceae bacterium]|nr:hypothetical protein [Oscillospiraceae bacterium]